jgi:hypothetical protein
MTLAEPIAVTLRVADALEKLGIRYLVGGSLASSVHGIPRSTQDIDLLVELAGAGARRSTSSSSRRCSRWISSCPIEAPFSSRR